MRWGPLTTRSVLCDFHAIRRKGTLSWAERDQTRYNRGMVSTQLVQLMLSLDFLNQRSLFVEVAAAPQMAKEKIRGCPPLSAGQD